MYFHSPKKCTLLLEKDHVFEKSSILKKHIFEFGWDFGFLNKIINLK